MTTDREEALTLELLDAIDARSDVTQRHLADRLGVALGLANSYLGRCVRKGLVKITQAPANRYLYYLTPQGFAEKSRLTAQYLSVSFDFYRRASGSVRRALQTCEAEGVERLLFAGISELAEIAFARSHDTSLDIIGTYSSQTSRTQYFGKPVWSVNLPAVAFDRVVLTALEDCSTLYQYLTLTLEPRLIVVPDLLAPLLQVDQAVPN
jgi:DNA-binding MarR family transcriptional regulator